MFNVCLPHRLEILLEKAPGLILQTQVPSTVSTEDNQQTSVESIKEHLYYI